MTNLPKAAMNLVFELSLHERLTVDDVISLDTDSMDLRRVVGGWDDARRSALAIKAASHGEASLLAVLQAHWPSAVATVPLSCLYPRPPSSAVNGHGHGNGHGNGHAQGQGQTHTRQTHAPTHTHQLHHHHHQQHGVNRAQVPAAANNASHDAATTSGAAAAGGGDSRGSVDGAVTSSSSSSGGGRFTAVLELLYSAHPLLFEDSTAVADLITGLIADVDFARLAWVSRRLPAAFSAHPRCRCRPDGAKSANHIAVVATTGGSSSTLSTTAHARTAQNEQPPPPAHHHPSHALRHAHPQVDRSRSAAAAVELLDASRATTPLDALQFATRHGSVEAILWLHANYSGTDAVFDRRVQWHIKRAH
ncbi:hypothetical protein DFJ73DRAFT_769343 [Zopfochytrium polystomum]|nr:hypothetical protein DFJ73DRAFT_769343 [Zopfochytrium polystomum]